MKPLLFVLNSRRIDRNNNTLAVNPRPKRVIELGEGMGIILAPKIIFMLCQRQHFPPAPFRSHKIQDSSSESKSESDRPRHHFFHFHYLFRTSSWHVGIASTNYANQKNYCTSVFVECLLPAAWLIRVFLVIYSFFFLLLYMPVINHAVYNNLAQMTATTI